MFREEKIENTLSLHLAVEAVMRAPVVDTEQRPVRLALTTLIRELREDSYIENAMIGG